MSCIDTSGNIVWTIRLICRPYPYKWWLQTSSDWNERNETHSTVFTGCSCSLYVNVKRARQLLASKGRKVKKIKGKTTMRKETKATCFLICSTDQGNEWIYGRRLTYSTTAKKKKKKKTLLELRFALSPAWRCHALHPCIYVCIYTQAIHSIVLDVFVCASPDCYVVALVLEKEENLVFPRFDSLLFIGWNISYILLLVGRDGEKERKQLPS